MERVVAANDVHSACPWCCDDIHGVSYKRVGKRLQVSVGRGSTEKKNHIQVSSKLMQVVSFLLQNRQSINPQIGVLNNKTYRGLNQRAQELEQRLGKAVEFAVDARGTISISPIVTWA